MALPATYQWTPANNGTTFPAEHLSHVSSLDMAAEAQRQQEQELLVWGLSIAVVLFLAVIGGTIRFRRVMATREQRLSRLVASGQSR
jgi:hypothetical protein